MISRMNLRVRVALELKENDGELGDSDLGRSSFLTVTSSGGF